MAASFTQQPGRIRLLEWLFAAAALFLSTNGLIPLLVGAASNGATDPTGGNLALELVWTAIYLVVGWRLLTLARSGSVNDVFRQRLMWLLVAVAALSTLWSDSPDVTFRRSVALAGTNLFAVYLAVRFGRQGLMRMLVAVLAVSAGLSLILPLVAPDLGLDLIRDDAWRGIYTTRNELARWMVLLAMVCLAWIAMERRARLIHVSLLCVAIGLMLQSQSKGALVVLTGLAVVLGLLLVLRRDRHLAVVGMSGFIALLGGASMWVIGHPTEAADLLGRDTTLTGRSLLWQVVWGYIGDRPWLGYGFNAFWLGPDSPGAYVRWLTNIDAPHAHTGVLDLWLGLGLVGVLIVGFALLSSAVRAIRVAGRANSAADLLPALFLAFLVCENIIESSLVTPNALLWILFVGLSAGLTPTQTSATPQKASPRLQPDAISARVLRARQV